MLNIIIILSCLVSASAQAEFPLLQLERIEDFSCMSFDGPMFQVVGGPMAQRCSLITEPEKHSRSGRVLLSANIQHHNRALLRSPSARVTLGTSCTLARKAQWWPFTAQPAS